MQGVLGQAHHSTNAIVHEIFGNIVFRAAMSRNKFKFLIAHILFNDICLMTRPNR